MSIDEPFRFANAWWAAVQNDNECIAAQGRSIELTSRFLHRYKMCQVTLATQFINEGSLIDKDSNQRYQRNSGAEMDNAATPRDAFAAANEPIGRDCSTHVAGASHFMTLFLQAYVTARQVSAEQRSP